jgi:hypothetical protein
MNLVQYTTVLLSSFISCVGGALADDVALDQPMTVDGVETACTGITSDVRADPKWRIYSLKIEFVGKNGQYLGDEQVNVSGNGQSILVHCEGPWALMKLPKGSYHIAIDVADVGHKEMTARLPASGQTHIIVRYPNAGGEVDRAVPEPPGKQASR